MATITKSSTTKSSTIRARVTPELKKNIEAIFERLGITTSEAINMFLSQVYMKKSIPFDVNIPNKKTQKILKEIREKKGLKTASLEGLMDEFK